MATGENVPVRRQANRKPGESGAGWQEPSRWAETADYGARGANVKWPLAPVHPGGVQRRLDTNAVRRRSPTNSDRGRLRSRNRVSSVSRRRRPRGLRTIRFPSDSATGPKPRTIGRVAHHQGWWGRCNQPAGGTRLVVSRFVLPSVVGARDLSTFCWDATMRRRRNGVRPACIRAHLGEERWRPA